MKFRLIFAAGLLALGGCATYDYTGGGSGGYYRGAPAVQYRYPPGYSPYFYGNPYGLPYGYGAGSIGLYDYPVYPVYRGGGGYYYRQYDRVRSTVRRARTARSTTGRAPAARGRNNPTALQQPAHRRRGRHRVSAHRRGSFARSSGKPHRVLHANRFRRTLTATWPTLGDIGGLRSADDWLQARYSV